MNHLALAVSDQPRSTRFYMDYFGFMPEPEPREDGVLILHDASGFSLALARSKSRLSCLHFCTSAALPPAPTRCVPFGIASRRTGSTSSSGGTSRTT